MSVVSVKAKSFILALFIRDDGERFLLGDNGYDFKDSQLHFAGNTIENDEVVKQGADGVILAGQVRRSAVQSFDGYIGDGTTPKETIEQMRRDFIAFFAKSHHFRVIYVDCNRNAWQRKGGYLVDAPEVKELWQIHPEYHVGLNFEDVNYYSYDEDADGNEILANVIDVPVSTEVAGGLEWDEDGAVSEEATVEYDTETATATPAKNIYITDATDAPLASFRLDGETSQNGTPTPSAPVAVNTTTGENVVKITGKNLLDIGSYLNASSDSLTFSYSNGKLTATGTPSPNEYANVTQKMATYLPVGTYTLSITQAVSHRIYLWVQYKDGTAASTFIINAGNTSATVSIGKEISQIRLDFAGMTVGTAINETFGIQLEKLNSASTFEPYNGQSYEVNLGKNLLDMSTLVVGYVNGSNGSITTTGIAQGERASGFIKVEPNSIYTVSIAETTSTYTPWFGIGEYTAADTSTFIRRQANTTTPTSYTITTHSTAQYVRVSGRNFADATKIQFEKWPSPTDYAAYFTPIELCKIGDYQDSIYKSDDKWYVHKETGILAVDTSTTTSSGTSYSNITYGQVLKNDDAKNKGTYSHYVGLCSHAIWSGNASNWNSADNAGKCYDAANGNRYWIGFASGTSLDDIKTALSGCKIVYPLATPTDTEIKNEALIAQLETLLNTARTYAGANNIFTVTPNEQGTLEISYYTKYHSIVTEGGYVWEAGGSGGTTTVVNDSIGSVNPIWKVYGPTTNPVLENITTGEQIEYIGTIGNGQTLTIDMGEQTASLDGLNVISNVIGDYISLASGANTLVYSVTGEAGASELGWSEIVG